MSEVFANIFRRRITKQKQEIAALYRSPVSALVREAGLEPARPEWTLEPESSESANSTTRAYSIA